MTSKLTITDERVISVIERLEHYACNLKWTNVRGAQDLLTAADGLRELQERRKAAMDSEPAMESEKLALENLRSAMEGIGHIRRTLEETFGGLHGTHVEPDVLAECKAICDAIYAAYRHAQPAPAVPDESYQQLSELYHTQEKRLFKIAQHIKGPAFDKYSHSPSQAIDVLEAAIFGKDDACRATMLHGNHRDLSQPIDPQVAEYEQIMIQAGNCREIAETSTNRSREHFISLCNEFWNWSEMDLVCADDRGYELRMEWDGKVFNHPVTQALWRMYQAAPTGIPIISDRWIPVSERMPDDEQQVIVQTHSGWRYVSFYDAHSRLFFDSPDGDIEHILVTHWMPLPAAPQEVK